jgi:protease IV
MFSRRHPFLFSFLIFSGIAAFAGIAMTLLVAFGLRGNNFQNLMPAGGGNVGVVEISGMIADAKDPLAQLKRFRKDDAIEAVLIRIDSPGGAVGPSQEIYRAVKRTAREKKVVASLGSVAASGGYYIAAAADGIMASRGTITGSIGVIMGFTRFERLMEKIGVVPVVIKSGAYKDMGSPVREMRPDERRILESLTRKIHNQFIEDVALGRRMEKARVASLADGRIFTGEESIPLGLVDRLGNFEDALEWAGKLAGIEGDVAPVYAKEKRFSLLDLLTGSTVEELSGRLLNPNLRAGYLYRP